MPLMDGLPCFLMTQTIHLSLTVGDQDRDLVFSDPDGSYLVFKRALPGLYKGVQITTTLRLDDLGLATALWEFRNPGTSGVPLHLNNYFYDDRGVRELFQFIKQYHQWSDITLV